MVSCASTFEKRRHMLMVMKVFMIARMSRSNMLFKGYRAALTLTRLSQFTKIYATIYRSISSPHIISS